MTTITTLTLEEAKELTQTIQDFMSHDNRENLLPATTLDLLWDIDFHEGGTIEGDAFGMTFTGDNGIINLNAKDLGNIVTMHKPFQMTFQ